MTPTTNTSVSVLAILDGAARSSRAGFMEIPRYNDSPDADLFKELELRSKAGA